MQCYSKKSSCGLAVGGDHGRSMEAGILLAQVVLVAPVDCQQAIAGMFTIRGAMIVCLSGKAVGNYIERVDCLC